MRACGRQRTIHEGAKRLAAHTRNGDDPEAHLRDFSELVGMPGAGATSGAPETLPTLDAPVAVLRELTDQGDPIATGLAVMDARLRGGPRPGKAPVNGGTAGAGKTALAIQAAKAAAKAGCVVVCLLSDEGSRASSG